MLLRRLGTEGGDCVPLKSCDSPPPFFFVFSSLFVTRIIWK